MDQLDFQGVVEAISQLSKFSEAWKIAGVEQEQKFRIDAFKQFRQGLSRLEKFIVSIDSPISLDNLKKLLIVLDNAKLVETNVRVLQNQSLANAIFHMDQICTVLGPEMGQRFFVKLQGSNKTLFNQQYGLFGAIVDDKFPDAVEDISESGKCLALGRYTASVFHVMRAMESGIHALAKSIGASFQDKNGQSLTWGVLTANIGEKIKSLPDANEKDEWLVLHSLLHAVNRAYRTKTAHPKATYSQEEATAAFDATKHFMLMMAERI